MTTTAQIRPVRTATPPPAQDQHRLALLWKAFEDAEERIRELERELDRRAHAPVAPVAPSAPAPAPREDRETLQAIARLEETVRAANKDQEGLRQEIAMLRGERDDLRRDLVDAKAEREADARRHAIVRAHLRVALEDVSQSLDVARTSHVAELRRYHAAQGIIRHERERAEALRAERDTAVAGMRHAIGLVARHAIPQRQQEPAPVFIPPATPRAMMPVRPYPVTLDRVSSIPGIRPDEVAALRRYGVNLVDALLYADLEPLSRAADIGLPRLWKLHALAQLMSLHGIGADSAERLFAAGIRGVDDVANAGAERIERILRESYLADGSAPETIALLAHTLPGRASAVVDEARRVVG